MLITLDPDAPLPKNYPPFGSPQFVEDLICTTIPPEPHPDDKSDEAEQARRLRQTFIEVQFHNCNDLCKQGNENRCNKRFPRPYSIETILEKNRYPTYRRPSPEDGGEVYAKKISSKVTELLDNSHVVPTSLFILGKYKCHNNIEWIGHQDCLDYITKYIMKGCDMAYVRLKRNIDGTQTVDYDEYTHCFKVRFMTAIEACWRIYSLPSVEMSHCVYRLWVHLPNGLDFLFHDGGDQRIDEMRKLLNEGKQDEVLAMLQRESTLTAYFRRVSEELQGLDERTSRQRASSEPRAFHLLYEEFPRYYTFDKSTKRWNRRADRAISKPIVARIGSVSPRNTEATGLRILLLVGCHEALAALRI
jgi:hypothetical protein